MTKDSKIPRAVILPLNLKDIEKSLPSVPQTKLIVSKNNVDSQPLTKNIVKSYTYSSDQVCVSRNKLGRELLQHCRYGFNLNDPNIYQSRFYVDYHRLHDPALKRYHNSVPVKSRLTKLELVTKQNDAICTHKEFADYLRYIDKNLALSSSEMKKREQARRLSNYFHSLKEIKEQESKFIGIFRKEKLKNEPKSMAYLDKERKLKIRLQIKKVNDAIERASKIKQETSTFFRFINLAKEKQHKRQMQTELQTEQRRKFEMNKNLDEKLKQARKRRQSLQKEKRITKIKGVIDHFMKHSAIRQEVLSRNIEIFEMHEEERRANLKARIKKNVRLQESNEIDKIKIRKLIFRKEQNADIIDKIMKNIGKLSDKYMKTVDPANFKEVSRRFSMLTRPFVIDCLDKVNKLFRNLHIQVPSVLLAGRTIKLMQNLVLIIPEIGNSKCEFVRDKVADIISNTINEIQNQRVSDIRSSFSIRNQKEESDKMETEHKLSSSDQKQRVILDESEMIIGESPYNEFIGELPMARVSLLETYYDLNTEIRRELKEMFEVITQCQFEFSDMFKTRDFLHLYDFQKYVLYKSIRRFTEMVNMKQYHYWMQKAKIVKWQALDLNLRDISFEAADSVMNFPAFPEQFVACVRKTSKLICIETDAQIET